MTDAGMKLVDVQRALDESITASGHTELSARIRLSHSVKWGRYILKVHGMPDEGSMFTVDARIPDDRNAADMRASIDEIVGCRIRSMARYRSVVDWNARQGRDSRLPAAWAVMIDRTTLSLLRHLGKDPITEMTATGRHWGGETADFGEIPLDAEENIRLYDSGMGVTVRIEGMTLPESYITSLAGMPLGEVLAHPGLPTDAVIEGVDAQRGEVTLMLRSDRRYLASRPSDADMAWTEIGVAPHMRRWTA